MWTRSCGGKAAGRPNSFLYSVKPDEVNPGRLRPREIREPGLRQRPRDLPGAVGAEVEEDDGVAVADRADGLTVLDEDGRLNELVGLAPGVGLGDRLGGAARPEAGRKDERRVRAGDPVPSLVAVHGVVAAGDGRDLHGRRIEHGLEPGEVTLGGLRRRVASVREGMDAHAGHPLPRREPQQPFEMALVGVDAAVGEKAHHVERRAAAPRGRAGPEQRGILLERAVAQREVDPQEVLRHHATRAERQVADLGVAHHAGGQPHRLAGGLEESPGVLGEPPVVDRRARQRDGVALRRRSVTPAVADEEEDRRRFFQSRAGARPGAAAAEGRRAGRGRRRSRSDSTCMKAMYASYGDSWGEK